MIWSQCVLTKIGASVKVQPLSRCASVGLQISWRPLVLLISMGRSYVLKMQARVVVLNAWVISL